MPTDTPALTEQVWVLWTASYLDDNAWKGDLAKASSLRPPWASRPSNTIALVESIASAYFEDPEEWDSCFGSDEEATLRIEIQEPAEIAGRFTVTLRREVVARAEKFAAEAV